MAATSSALALPAPPEALAREVWVLEPPPRAELAALMRDEAGFLLHRLLARVARGRGALDVALGEGLAALAVGDRALRLGYSGVGDYSRERLGIGGRTAQALARLARELRTRPLLREAVRRGEVSLRKAQVVVGAAAGEDEATWVLRARTETVRALEARLRRARRPGARASGDVARSGGDGRGGGDDGARGDEDAAGGAVGPEHGGDPTRGPFAADDDEEPWDRIVVSLSPESGAKIERAMEVAGRVLGRAAPRWQRLEAMCQEVLGAHPVEPGEDERSAGDPGRAGLDLAREALEAELQAWRWLDETARAYASAGEAPLTRCGEPLEAPAVPEGERAFADPHRLDAELREIAAMRDRWDELLGHLAMLMKRCGLWRDMRFASFGHYCEERLGMSARAVEQRAALARRLYALPELRTALREARISYEKARLVASCADAATARGWLARAERLTCVALRREMAGEEEAQMRAARRFSLRVPRRVGILLDAAFRAIRAGAGRWLTPEECLVRVGEHFVETWEDAVPERRSPGRRAFLRDRGLCRTPGCSRAAAHVHHVEFRSRGGGEDPTNLVSLCPAHHLHGVHAGYVRVSGLAPDHLTWELGVRADGPPLQVFRPGTC